MFIQMNDGKKLIIEDDMTWRMRRAAKMPFGIRTGPILGRITKKSVTVDACAEDDATAIWLKGMPRKEPVQFIGCWTLIENSDAKLIGPFEFKCSHELSKDVEPLRGAYVVVFGPECTRAYWSHFEIE